MRLAHPLLHPIGSNHLRYLYSCCIASIFIAYRQNIHATRLLLLIMLLCDFYTTFNQVILKFSFKTGYKSSSNKCRSESLSKRLPPLVRMVSSDLTCSGRLIFDSIFNAKLSRLRPNLALNEGKLSTNTVI